MLNTFPELLTYSFFAPTLLRVVVAIALFHLAYHGWQRRTEIAEARSKSFSTISIVFNLLVGCALFFGYYTQIAALLAIASFLVGAWANRRYPHIVILPTSTIKLLAVMCASILLTGAGALAMDLPL